MNREGVIVSEPITGAAVEEYKQRFDELLNDKEVTRSQRTNSYANSEGMYRIRVISDDPPGEYEVHVLKVPEGFDEDTSVYRTDDQHSDMVITLERS